MMAYRVALLWIMTLPGTGAAEAPAADEAIQSGRAALESTSRLPWYDPETDQVRRIDVRTDAGDDDRGTDWESSWTPNFGNRSMRRGPRFSFGRFAQVVAVILFVVLIVGLVVALTRTFLRTEESRASSLPDDDIRSDVDRVEQLPFQLNRPQANLFEEARRHYEAGRYGEAIIYLFSYKLVELDKHQLIRLTKGKTNRQYLREVVRSRPDARGLLERTMTSFEEVFFGHHPLDRRQFEQCWNGLDQFHKMLHEASA